MARVVCAGGATAAGARSWEAGGRGEAPVAHDCAEGQVRQVAVPRTRRLVGVAGEAYDCNSCSYIQQYQYCLILILPGYCMA